MNPLPPFLPDQSPNSGALQVATNVYPRADGYGPVKAFASVSDAIGSDFKGGAAFIAGDGTSTLLVGTADGLVKYDSGAWSDLETGMTVSGAWRFTQFGNYAIGVNGTATKVVDLSAGTSGALTGAPAGVCICVIGDYVVIGQDAGDLLGIYYSAANDHTDWTPAIGGPGIQPMLTGGEVMGLAGGEYGVILQRQRIVRMTRTGDANAPFQYDEIAPNVGCAAKGSVCASQRTVFFLSDRGFMALDDGQALKPIGSEKVDRWFQDRVSRDDYSSIQSAIDPVAKTVTWLVPGSPCLMVIYNWELDRFSTAELALEGIFAAFTSSLTLEAVSALYPDIDAMPYSLDDSRFSGGNPRLYAVSGGELGTFAGDTLAAEFQSSFMQHTEGRVTRFEWLRPVGDSISGDAITLDVRARLGDPPVLVAASAMRDNGVMPVRASGRYVRVMWEKAAGSVWTYAQGLEFKKAAGGER